MFKHSKPQGIARLTAFKPQGMQKITPSRAQSGGAFTGILGDVIAAPDNKMTRAPSMPTYIGPDAADAADVADVADAEEVDESLQGIETMEDQEGGMLPADLLKIKIMKRASLVKKRENKMNRKANLTAVLKSIEPGINYAALLQPFAKQLGSPGQKAIKPLVTLIAAKVAPNIKAKGNKIRRPELIRALMSAM